MNLMHFKDPRLLTALPPQAGVYWMIWSETPYGSGPVKPHHIQRLTGTDEWGVLYIGCADDLKFRAGRNCVTLALNATGNELWPEFYPRLALFDYFHSSHALRQIPKECLALAWEPTTDELGANKLEQMLYYNYRQKFAERPPFQRDFSMGKWISPAEERRMRGPLVMPETRYYPV